MNTCSFGPNRKSEVYAVPTSGTFLAKRVFPTGLIIVSHICGKKKKKPAKSSCSVSSIKPLVYFPPGDMTMQFMAPSHEGVKQVDCVQVSCTVFSASSHGLRLRMHGDGLLPHNKEVRLVKKAWSCYV